MIFTQIKNLFIGNKNAKIINKLYKDVHKINDLEPEIKKLSDVELREKTVFLRKKLANGNTLDDILHEAFAVAREASRRVLNMRHFDVQLIGGIILHRGGISEMSTGEGKTLVATLAVYLNAIAQKGVHVVTVNDYLAKRDAAWMGKLYDFLGLTFGCINSNTADDERKKAYQADITYGTNNEFGFDYLRDNMKFSKDELVQREFNFAIIDEVDSILIDEARTPLIISGPTDDNSDLYRQIDKLIPKLDKKDFVKDEKNKSINLTDVGISNVEALLAESKMISKDSSLYDPKNIHFVHHINQSLKAHKLFSKDTDYMVKEGQILIIDDFTGRALEGRRYSEGLHQAIEAKENLHVRNENQTLASITFQNFFRLYPKISGMTGTAATESEEFFTIYGLSVVSVPTNKDRLRQDLEDEVYRSENEKYEAIVKQIEECSKRKQPVLVGTVSIEKSEYISSLLKNKKIKHQVLNAKYHASEAEIIAQAGRIGAVTIATNMAGRGTDIMLGGNAEFSIKKIDSKLIKGQNNQLIQDIITQVKIDKAEVMKSGGLFVIGTERHESRRIDNQLRGRSGRQGDPGKTKFYLSLEDDLMRIFSSDKISGVLQKLGLEYGEAICHPMITKALERAQQKVESRNYEIRKNLLQFDDVSNDQRKIIYQQRKEVMLANDLKDIIKDIRLEVNEDIINKYIVSEYDNGNWDIKGLNSEISSLYAEKIDFKQLLEQEELKKQLLLDFINQKSQFIMQKKYDEYGENIMSAAEKHIFLITIDKLWQEHLYGLDHLRQGIGLRAYGQKDPLNEYKKEAFNMFEYMLNEARVQIITKLCHMQLSLYEQNGEIMLVDNFGNKKQHYCESRVDPATTESNKSQKFVQHEIKHVEPALRDKLDSSTWGKVGRNEKCPCGSGKKFKHCHGSL